MKMNWQGVARKWKGELEKYKYVLLVICLGAVLMLLPEGQREKPAPEAAQAANGSFDLAALEEKMERTLSKVEGAGEVRVLLTLNSDGRQILAQDREQDRDGGGASTTVTVGRGSGQQEVVPLQRMAPDFRGALVVCSGAEDPRVRLTLLEAVSALTGLGANRISICQSGS